MKDLDENWIEIVDNLKILGVHVCALIPDYLGNLTSTLLLAGLFLLLVYLERLATSCHINGLWFFKLFLLDTGKLLLYDMERADIIDEARNPTEESIQSNS